MDPTFASLQHLQEKRDILMNNSQVKRQRLNHDGTDRINSLPDGVLIHMLSFLPTADAVRTCILSKRWEFLWTYLRNINFDDRLYLGEVNMWNPQPGLTRFLDGIGDELVSQFMFDMKKLRLSFRVFFDAIRVHNWLVSAILRKVLEVDLCLFVGEPFILPRMVFVSTSLTVLKIEMNSVLQLPRDISLPCLKTLCLSLVTFSGTKLTQKLFSSCPVLEDLALVDCEWLFIRSVTISIPTLKTLKMDELPCFGSTDSINDCQIKIYGENLVSLKYNGSLSNDIFLYNISSLVVAYIDIPNLYKMDREIARRGAKLLRGLGNAQYVRMSNGAIESVFLAENFLDHLPIFRKLVHLKLNMVIGACTIGALMDLFQRSPNLESIVFSKGIGDDLDIRDNVWKLKYAPECLFSHLKTIDLHWFRGIKTEINLLKLVLKFAPVLERINIHCSKILLQDMNKRNEIFKQLLMLEDGPRVCTIVFL